MRAKPPIMFPNTSLITATMLSLLTLLRLKYWDANHILQSVAYQIVTPASPWPTAMLELLRAEAERLQAALDELSAELTRIPGHESDEAATRHAPAAPEQDETVPLTAR